MRTFPIGGIHPHDNKEWSKDKAIETLELPSEVYIPMIQHIGAPSTPIVKKGDKVLTGQLIGQSVGFVSANIHASVSGTVTSVDAYPNGQGQRRIMVVIKREEAEPKTKGRGKKKEESPLFKVPVSVPIGEENPALFEELRILRKRLADQQAIPAYIVLSDKTLHLLVAQRPTTIEEFGMVNGIGDYKKERYGKEFVEVIKKHVRE